MKRGRLERRTELARGAPPQRRRRKRDPKEAAKRAAWIKELWRRADRDEYGLARCAVTGETELDAAERLEGHHVIEKEHIRQKFPNGHGGRSLVDLVWDPRNGMLVLVSVHQRHTKRYKTIPIGAVPADAFEFARELGLEWYLAGRYDHEEDDDHAA